MLQVFNVLDQRIRSTGRRIWICYLLLQALEAVSRLARSSSCFFQGINDSADHARALAQMLRDRPSETRCALKAFKHILASEGDRADGHCQCQQFVKASAIAEADVYILDSRITCIQELSCELQTYLVPAWLQTSFDIGGVRQHSAYSYLSPPESFRKLPMKHLCCRCCCCCRRRRRRHRCSACVAVTLEVLQVFVPREPATLQRWQGAQISRRLALPANLQTCCILRQGSPGTVQSSWSGRHIVVRNSAKKRLYIRMPLRFLQELSSFSECCRSPTAKCNNCILGSKFSEKI